MAVPVESYDIGGVGPDPSQPQPPFVQSTGYVITFTAPLLGNVSGWSAHLQVRNHAGGTVYLDLFEGSGITITATPAAFTCSFLGADTSKVPAGEQNYDLIVAAPAGQPLRLCFGRVFCQAPITAPPVE